MSAAAIYRIEANNGAVPLFTCNATTSILRRMTKPPASPTRQSPKFDLRLPDDMRAQVALAAKREGRSMNSQIVAYVRAGLEGMDPTEVVRSIKDIDEKVARVLHLLEREK